MISCARWVRVINCCIIDAVTFIGFVVLFRLVISQKKQCGAPFVLAVVPFLPNMQG